MKSRLRSGLEVVMLLITCTKKRLSLDLDGTIHSETAGKGPLRNAKPSIKGRRARTVVPMSERRVLQERAPGSSHRPRLQKRPGLSNYRS